MTLGCVHVFVLLRAWNPPEYVIHTTGRFCNPIRGKQVLKFAESHRCEVNTLWKLDCNFSTFSEVSRRDSV